MGTGRSKQAKPKKKNAKSKSPTARASASRLSKGNGKNKDTGKTDGEHDGTIPFDAAPATTASDPAPLDVKDDGHDAHSTDHTDHAGDEAEADSPAQSLTIVGVGASAGGLEAFTQLIRALTDSSGMAIVFVQHLAPKHVSHLAELLQRETPIPVDSITDSVEVQPGRIYVSPPNVQVHIHAGRLHLAPRPPEPTHYMPIDFFFRSLAEHLESRAIGVVLSGTASDGAIGLREIKAMGGITIAQDPSSARYDGMVRAAIATGAIDLVRTPDVIAAELTEIASHPYVRKRKPPAQGEDGAVTEEQLRRILTLLRSASGIDFSHYKQPTIKRRLERRMLLQKISKIETYIRMLTEDEAEARNLSQDILIHVTCFFREPESFEALKTLVFPHILDRANGNNTVRIWVPGCATGEEAYSVAIALLECLGDRAHDVAIQIFATDVSDAVIDVARAGYYPESISADVSAERLRGFFIKADGNYRVQKKVRDLCIFARQDLTRDPPFSRLDLILCRNVLIYLDQALQKKLMTIFHYGLRPNGFLMLAGSETIGASAEYFTLVDKKHKIYGKRANVPPVAVDFGGVDYHPDAHARKRDAPDRLGRVQHEASRLLIGKYAPPGVIVDENFQIVQYHGRTGLFLEPPPGDPSQNLIKMAREGLVHSLRNALHEARKSGSEMHVTDLRVRTNGSFHSLNLHVLPLTTAAPGFYLVLFETQPEGLEASRSRGRAKAPKSKKAPPPTVTGEVKRLESELAATREYMQSVIQDLEAANEELQSANEEILSSNEELQSTNEELDTAREELQSTNEELNTVNDELHARNDELSRVNSDLLNLLGSVQIAIVIVSSDLRIRRFTPMAEKVLNLIPGDIGRPISHLKPNINCPDLEDMIASVVDSVSVQEREVQDRQGNWFVLRIRPYKNVENKIDGAVLVLIDIDASKRAEVELESVRQASGAIMDAVHEPLAIIDGELRVQLANEAFQAVNGADAKALVGKKLSELGGPGWNAPELSRQLSTITGSGPQSARFDVTDGHGDGEERYSVSVRRIEGRSSDEALLFVSLRRDGNGRPE